MAASAVLTAFVDQLIDLFNRRSPDLPDGYFTRHTQFSLNEVPFEEMLGRSPTDPLVLMLTRGAAGYRFTAKALQHAIPDATLQRGELHEIDEQDTRIVRGQCWVSGRLRTGEPIELLVDVELRFRGSVVERANVAVDQAQLARLHAARLRA
jgi:hypothetical protein